MQSPILSLQAGLEEKIKSQGRDGYIMYASAFGSLSVYAAWLIEGSADQKNHARKELKKLIGRGRCILNAADFNAGLKKKQGSVCGDPAYAEPCINPSAEACGDCLAVPPVEGGTP